MPEQSKFNTRADQAAEALKKSMDLEPQKVVVGPDGRPPPAPPPEGSYLAMQLEQQRAAAAERQTVLGDQPVAGTVDDLTDGSVAQPAPPEAQQIVEPAPETTPNVQKRFSELTRRLRESETARQEAEQKARDTAQTNAELASRMQAIEEQHNKMLQENLDALDPEMRMQVLQDARMQELFAGLKKELFDSIMPHVQGLEQSNVQREMMELGGKYPAFDIQVHGPLIDMFRGKNPNCSVEQAYRAIAVDEELVTRTQHQRGAPIPPTVAPGGPVNAAPRYVPQPEPDPEQEMIEDAQRIKQLRASADPREQKEGLRLAEKNIHDRLSRSRGWD
jgi:hypothetical protein